MRRPKSEKDENGWHSPRASKVMCANCRPPDISESLPPVAHPRSSLNPVGGTSALGSTNAKKDTNWRKGATGEYLMIGFSTALCPMARSSSPIEGSPGQAPTSTTS